MFITPSDDMITGETKFLALIGDPVKHSVSPQMHNSALREMELNYVYAAFKVPESSLKRAVAGLKALGIKGINVTIPHKRNVIKHLDEMDETAERIGAVNTIKISGKMKGFNTDGRGALRALKSKTGELKDKKIVILGAGGACRAIAFTLAEKEGKIVISNRTASKAEKLADEISQETGKEIEQIRQEQKYLKNELEDSDILINSTSVGMHPNEDETILTSDQMHSGLTVMDIVYNPIKTKLLKEAEKAGAETIDGLEMLVQQGASALEIWTDESPPIEIMRNAARKAMEEN